MVYYIRFVRVPEVKVGGSSSQGKIEVSCSFDIRNDLGENLYTEPVTVTAAVFDAVSKQTIDTLDAHWQGHEWAKEIMIPISRAIRGTEVILRLRCKTMPVDAIQGAGKALLIASTQSVPLVLREGERTAALAERLSFQPDGKPTVAPWEEVGSSIYGHVWDAGVILSAHIIELSERHSRDMPPLESPFAKILTTLPTRSGPPLRVLELGAGVGIVSLSMAYKCSNCVVVPTDTADAFELLRKNVRRAEDTLDLRSKIDGPWVVHWDRRGRQGYRRVQREAFDIILISDCTYNSSSASALVKTIKDAAKTSQTLVVVGLKRRHDDESVFYELMEEAKFEVVHHQKFDIPDPSRLNLGLEEEEIELYEYRLVDAD